MLMQLVNIMIHVVRIVVYILIQHHAYVQFII